MGLLSKSLGIRALSLEDPAQPLLPQSAMFESLGLGRSDAGVLVNEKQAMRITTVLSCINIIQQDLGSLPLAVYQNTGDHIREAKETKVYGVIQNPHEVMSPAVFWGALIARAVGWGNGYALIVRDKAARPVSFIPLASDKTAPVSIAGKFQYGTTQTDSGEVAYVDPINILHVPGLVMDGVAGMSPIQVCKNAFGLTMAAEKFGAQFFGNGARATGVLSHPETLDAEAYENLKKSVREWATGETALRPIILEEGMKWEQITIPPNDAQFIDTRKFQRSEMASLYRVALHLLQDLERATNNNIEHQSLDHVRYCLKPWAVRVEQELNRKLFGKNSSYFVEFDMNDILRGDFASQTAGFQSLRNIGVLSTDDILRKLRMNPIGTAEGGDVRTVQGAMIPLTAYVDGQWQGSLGAQENTQQAEADEGQGDPTANNQHAQVIRAYRRVFRDAVGRVANRKNPDVKAAYDALYPGIAAMGEAVLALDGATLAESDQEKIAACTRELVADAASWTKQNASEIATQLTEQAYTALQKELK